MFVPTFRQRILGVLILVGALPTAAAILGWAFTLRQANPTATSRVAVDAVAASGRELLRQIDTTRLDQGTRSALAEHAARLNEALVRSERADAYGRYYAAGLTFLVLGAGVILLYASVRLGGHLSRQLSRPIDELVGWTGHIKRHEPLPSDRTVRGAPEFAALRTALREMAASLERARQSELEAERLRAFREVARRVAHEMKNPLTPIRFAIAQLAPTATPAQREAIEVLAAESRRLEELAREFAEFGRLPEGPPAEVDLGELAAELLRTSVPPGVRATLDVAPDTPPIIGHYDPLRRALANLLRNAVEAMQEDGALEVRVRPNGTGWVNVEIADHGPGIPAAVRERLFEPYTTTKAEGTGLGLSLVKGTIELHGGTVSVRETTGGGATFVLMLPVHRVGTQRSSASGAPAQPATGDV